MPLPVQNRSLHLHKSDVTAACKSMTFKKRVVANLFLEKPNKKFKCFY